MPQRSATRQVRLGGRHWLGGVAASALSLAAVPGFSATPVSSKAVFSSQEPVLLEAAQVDYDHDQAVATASGRVEIVQGDTILLADRLSYDQSNNLVTAEGNVSMLEPSGHVFFADRLELKDDLKTGVIRQFKARLADNSLFAAAGARKIDENKIELFKAVYSPCHVKCDPGGEAKSPLWQVSAKHVLIDQEEERIKYDDAFMEIYGFPIVYTPYFSHPTPDAQNVSGLLTPEFQHTSNLGNTFKVPVYYVISQDKDLTLTPIYSDTEGLVMSGEYRQLLDSGKFSFDGSLTRPQDRDAQGSRTAGHTLRGHINGNGVFALDNSSNWGFDIHRTTDDTYLRRYNFSRETLLTSTLYAERYNLPRANDRSYASIRAISFQGLTAQDDQDSIPVIMPMGDLTLQSDPGIYNSRFSLDVNALVLYRDEGANSRRLSSTVGWKLPYISDDGQVIEFEAQLRGDIYGVNEHMLANGTVFDGTTGRLVPQASLTWRYPFINRFERASLMFEPIANFTASPSGGNPEEIPNEDSRFPEFTDTNLFSANRFAGYDRVENGPRMSYGMRGQAQFMENKYLNWLFGQHYRIDNDRNFPFSNQVDSHFSDYVGKVGLDYDPVSVAYRFRLDKDNWNANREEVDAIFNYYPISVTASYLSLRNDPILATKEEISGTSALNLTKQWVWNLGARHDLEIDQTTSIATGFTFTNECTNVTTVIGREYTRDRDVKPATTFLFRISLKNLE